MGTVTGRSRSGLARQAGFISAGVVILAALAWLVAGAVAPPRVLAKYREAYESAKFARDNPNLSRIFSDEKAVQASEVFARDYEALEESGLIMAPIRSAAVAMSHDDYQGLVNPTEREKFEKERAEREKREKENDAERLKQIRENEKEVEPKK